MLEKKVAQWKAWLADAEVEADKYGYQDFKLGDGSTRSALRRADAAGGCSSARAAA